MTRFNQDDINFFDKISEDHKPSESHTTPKEILSLANKAARIMHQPSTTIARALVSAGTRSLVKESFAKLAGMSPVQIYSLLTDHYKRDWWDWEPETIWQTLKIEFGVDVDRAVRDNVMAIQVVLNTDAPFEHWHIFEKVGHAFNGNPVEFQITQPLNLLEIAWTVKVLKTLRAQEELEPEIYGYIAAAAKNSGVVYLPPEYFGELSQSYLDKLGNDALLKEKVRLKKDDGSAAYKIQVLGLKEIEGYLENKAHN